MKVFDKEIASVITRNLGKVKEAHVGHKLAGEGWEYIEFVVEGENYHVAPRVFVYEYHRFSAQTVVMKSYEAEEKNARK
jgi:hypothetical protein